MTNEEAKFVLSGYRANGSDANDPMFREALRQAQADPALAAWFAREQAHTAAVSAKLAQIAPPAGLREAILAGGRVSGVRRETGRAPMWIGLAAAVAIVAGGTALWPKRGLAGESAVTAFALRDAAEAATHGGRGDAVSSLFARLANPATRLSEALPVAFADLAEGGCRTLDVAGKPVLEICFNRGGQWFHCYIARSRDFPELAEEREPVYATRGKVNAVTWADDVHRFVVAAVAERDVLARLL